MKDFYEFTGPNFNNNGYSLAKYRASNQTVDLDGFTVPVRLEALNKQNEWQQHPVVFKHSKDFIVFRDRGVYTFVDNSSQNSPPVSEFIKKAEELGLMQGSRDIASFVKEEK